MIGVYPSAVDAWGVVYALKRTNRCPQCGKPVRLVGKNWKVPILRCEGNYSRALEVPCRWECVLDFDVEVLPKETTLEKIIELSVQWFKEK
jgi:hypothetical protein